MNICLGFGCPRHLGLRTILCRNCSHDNDTVSDYGFSTVCSRLALTGACGSSVLQTSAALLYAVCQHQPAAVLLALPEACKNAGVNSCLIPMLFCGPPACMVFPAVQSYHPGPSLHTFVLLEQLQPQPAECGIHITDCSTTMSLLQNGDVQVTCSQLLTLTTHHIRLSSILATAHQKQTPCLAA